MNVLLAAFIVSLGGLLACNSVGDRSGVKSISDSIDTPAEIALESRECKKTACSNLAATLNKIEKLNNTRFGDPGLAQAAFYDAILGIFAMLQYNLWEFGEAETKLALHTQISICYELNSEPEDTFSTDMLEDISYARAILDEILILNNVRPFACRSPFDNHIKTAKEEEKIFGKLLAKKDFIVNRLLPFKKPGKGWSKGWRHFTFLHPAH